MQGWPPCFGSWDWKGGVGCGVRVMNVVVRGDAEIRGMRRGLVLGRGGGDGMEVDQMKLYKDIISSHLLSASTL